MLTFDMEALRELMRGVFREELARALAICDREEEQQQQQQNSQTTEHCPPTTNPIDEQAERAKMHALCKQYISQWGRESIMLIWKQMGVSKFSEVPIERYLELASYISEGDKLYKDIKAKGHATGAA